MADEKTPKLFLSKSPFEYGEKRGKICSRSTISWVLAALLISLVFIAAIEFWIPDTDGRLKSDQDCIISIYEEQPNTVKAKPPVVTDYVSEHLHKDSERKGKSVKKDTGVNPWDLDFLIDPTNLCATHNPPNSEQYLLDPEVKLLILVTSSTGHFLQRKAIRNTWGSIADRPFGPIRLGFVLGTTLNRTEDDLIHEESLKYRDIIQASLDDTNRQLTRKSVLMLKWMAERCPHAQYFLKADDNTFVNVSTIANILAGEPFISEEKFIGGYVQKGVQPSRILEEAHYIAVEDYSNDEYPPYASGSAYVTTGPTAVELFRASNEVQPFLPIEDVFVTGLLGGHIDATLIHEPRFSYDGPPNPPSWQSLSNLATAHSISPRIMELIWNEITKSLSAMDILLNQEAAINATVILGKKRRFITEQK